jgi:hypothetical protein
LIWQWRRSSIAQSAATGQSSFLRDRDLTDDERLAAATHHDVDLPWPVILADRCQPSFG